MAPTLLEKLMSKYLTEYWMRRLSVPGLKLISILEANRRVIAALKKELVETRRELQAVTKKLANNEKKLQRCFTINPTLKRLMSPKLSFSPLKDDVN